ncbi:sulfotransferase domain-containing protein [Qipengyuania qiaonensis]|nr:sulfotransferase domain-containing protein [Qipengyuania qiaonensis]
MRRAASEWARDGYVLSYPKSGRTWLRTMLGSMVCSQYGLKIDNPMELQHFWKLSSDIPNIGFTHDDSPNLKFGHEVDKDKSRYRNKRVLLLTRDPRDVLVSYYFDAKNRMKVIDCDISTYIHREKGSIDAIVAFYNSWAEARFVPRDFLWVSYEDMHSDPRQVLLSTAGFFGLPAPDGTLLEETVEKASFRNMRKAELHDSFGHERLRPADPQNPESFKVRRGKVGGFVDYLSSEDIAYIDAYIDRNLHPFFACYFSKEKIAQSSQQQVGDSRNPLSVSTMVGGDRTELRASNDNYRRERLVRMAAAIALFASGWIANELDTEFAPPANAASLVSEAQEAYVASSVRAQMASQIESSDLDRGEILHATGVELPEIPEDWVVTDAQLYPSDLGNSVVLTMVTADDERVSLFAAEEDTSIGDSPSMDLNNGVAVAYWEDGQAALALVGELEAPRLLELATTLDRES